MVWQAYLVVVCPGSLPFPRTELPLVHIAVAVNVSPATLHLVLDKIACDA